MHRIGLRAGFPSIMVLAEVAQAAEVTINAARSGEGLRVGAPDSAVVREWGRHTSAYIARRCFDGPWLLERYLSLTEP